MGRDGVVQVFLGSFLQTFVEIAPPPLSAGTELSCEGWLVGPHGMLSQIPAASSGEEAHHG